MELADDIFVPRKEESKRVRLSFSSRSPPWSGSWAVPGLVRTWRSRFGNEHMAESVFTSVFSSLGKRASSVGTDLRDNLMDTFTWQLGLQKLEAFRVT